MFPEELVNALKVNGFATTKTRTLQQVWTETAQDGGYSVSAFENAKILVKYINEYGSLTVENILNPK